MKLRLFINRSILEISNVKLREGYIPSLSEYTYAGKIKVIDEKPTEFLEPAVWFKIFLMDILTIDCNFRSTYWTLGTQAEDISDITDKTVEEVDITGVDELKNDLVGCQDLYDESYKLGDDCVDYFNDLDEVYDVLPSMLNMYKNGKITKDEFYKSLIKLIHVNVLPNVKLLPEHLDLLKKCFHVYKRYMKNMNDIIAGKTSQLSDLKATKLRERQKFLRTINSTKEPKIFDELINILEGEYKKDLERVAYDYRKMQMDYVRFVCDKAPLEETMKLLNKVESLKNEIVGLNGVLENIKKMKGRSSISKVFFRLNSPYKEEAIMQNMYLKMKETEDVLQKKVYRVMDKKLMLLTVYENMRNVIQELMEGFESYGVDFDTKSRMKSNILAETCVSIQWKSLPEHVNIILSNLDHDITKDHYLMVGKVKEILVQTLKKYKAQSQYNFMVPQLVKQYLPSLLKSGNILDSIHDSYNYNSDKDICTSQSSEKHLEDIKTGKTNALDIKSTNDVVSRSCSITLFNHLTRSHSTNDLNLFPLQHSPPRCFSLPSMRIFSNVDNGTTRYHKNLMTQPSFQSYIEKENFIKNNDFGYLLETIQQLRPMISDHFKSICMKLNIEIDNCYYRQNFRKIWVIYENYFYEHILNMILDLYRAQFAPKTEVLTEWIFKLNLDDLDMADTKTTRLLLTSPSDELCTDSLEDIDGKASDDAIPAKNGNETENSGSSSSLITAIIEGLTTQEEVFYDIHSDDGDHLKRSVTKKLGNVASAVDKVLKSKMRAKSTDIDKGEDNLMQKLPDSGIESSGQTIISQHNKSDSTSNLTPHSLKPKSEKKYFSTSVKPLTLDLDKYITDSSLKPIRMKPIAMNRFLRAYSHLKIALRASTPLVKTHHMCRCLKEVSNQLIQLHKDEYNSTLVVCNDTLMDSLIILVCNLDEKEIVSDLYVQLQLMTDMLADLFEAGEYRFALVMFQGVCQYLQDKTMMKKNRLNHTLRS